LVPEILLKYIFILFVIFALYRLFADSQKEEQTTRVVSKGTLFGIGVAIGIFAISIGVGGALILIPLLSGFLHYPLKKAVSAGLFFVMFSSVSGLLGRLLYGEIDMSSGIIVGIASLGGVYMGIWFKDSIHTDKLRYLSILMYSMILLVMLFKI